MNHVERFSLIGSFELGQNLKHQVLNAKSTNFPLLHLVICGVVLGALILDKPTLFFMEASPRSLSNGRSPQVLMLMEKVENLLPKCSTLFLDTKIGSYPISIQVLQITKS
jgi:hypothetical protein